jgi:hypothetical protein
MCHKQAAVKKKEQEYLADVNNVIVRDLHAQIDTGRAMKK